MHANLSQRKEPSQGPDRQRPFAPLVIGLPRSGFSLTAAVLGQLFYRVPNKFGGRQRALRAFCQTFGTQLSHSIRRGFEEHGKLDKVLLNDNFGELAGGPIWNNDALGTRAYFRKYIGVRGEGDFTLLTSHPLEILDQYEVVHSHGPFSDWVTAPAFEDCLRFASARNPVGVINSACHSLNALASEYIQKVTPDIDVEQTRKELALYKLSDLKFFDALLQPLKRGFLDQIATKQHYRLVRWEDLIVDPKATIEAIVEHAGLRVSNRACEAIWSKISYRNLTGAHKHNYRVGKAYIGDERESIVNEHIDIMKEAGFDEIAKAFGFGPLEYIEPKDYSDFQRTLSDALKKGEVLDPLKDRALFGLAFNKSNVDFAGFGFRIHDWRENTRVERSDLDDPKLELSVWSRCEETVRVINELLATLLGDLSAKTGDLGQFSAQARRCADQFPAIDVDTSVKKIANAAKHDRPPLRELLRRLPV